LTLILRTVAAGGLHPEFEHVRTRQRRAVQTEKDASSPRSREINERGINRYTLSWKGASIGQVFQVKKLWKDALGTTLPMQFTPMGHTDADVEPVYFVAPPKITRAGPLTKAIEFEVEGRH
jgi:hypothetical protein